MADPSYGRPGAPSPDPGLPALPELTAALVADPSRAADGLPTAACGYWARRGLTTTPAQTVAAPGGPALLLALAAATGGDVLVPRPCAAWWAPGVRLLGRTAYPVPAPAESGGVPDPYALLETVRRVRAEGGDPRLLIVSVADDPTGTLPEPEALDEVLRAAADTGLTVLSDETWRDTVHDAAAPALLSPAAIHPEGVVVLTDLAGAFLPSDWPAAVARFPAGAAGAALRERTLDALTAQGAPLAGPLAAAAAHALTEPAEATARLRAVSRTHGALARAAHRAVRAAGALALPPHAGRCLYVDLEPLRAPLAARGVADARDLEVHLGERLGMPVPGGHRFGDALTALRVRVSTASLLRSTGQGELASLTASEPLELPGTQRALSMFAAVFDALAAGEGAEPGEGAATKAGAEAREADSDAGGGRAHRREPHR